MKFFNDLVSKIKAECIYKENELFIHLSNSSEFDEQILKDLIKEGYSGDELIKEFRVRQAKVKSSINKMLLEADKAAQGKAKYMTMSDVFSNK